MDKMCTSPVYTTFFFLATFSFLTLPLVSSRCTLFPSSKTHDILNVTAYLHHLLAPSFHDHLIHPQSSKISDSSSSHDLTLKIHSPKIVHIGDYKSLMLKRLTRDSTRVHSIQTRLDLTIKSDLGAPIISGTSQGSGEYFTQVGIGKPPRDVYMIIDTGSDISWVQCEPCSHCYTQSDPKFNPTHSNTFRSLPCNSSLCDALDISDCRLGHCQYEVSYGDGSYTSGNFVTETMTFDGGNSINKLAVGCGHNNDGYFSGAGGLLGLGGGPLSLPSQIKASFFSYCLVDRDSSSASTLEFNNNHSVAHSSASVTAPLIRNPMIDTFYYLGIIGFRVGGKSLEISSTAFQIDRHGNGGMIIDSGTAVTRLESAVYELLRDEFRRGTSHVPSADEVAIFDTCYDLRGRDSVEFPAVELLFTGGRRLALPAKNYVIPVDTDGTFCFAFAPTTSSMSILGNVQQQGIRVGFNLVRSVVTFEPNAC